MAASKDKAAPKTATKTMPTTAPYDPTKTTTLTIPPGWILQNVFPSPHNGPHIWIVLFKSRDPSYNPPAFPIAGQGYNAGEAIADAIEELNSLLRKTATQRNMALRKANLTTRNKKS